MICKSNKECLRCCTNVISIIDQCVQQIALVHNCWQTMLHVLFATISIIFQFKCHPNVNYASDNISLALEILLYQCQRLGRYRANIPCSLVTCYITIFNRKFYLPTQVPPTYSIIIKCDSHTVLLYDNVVIIIKNNLIHQQEEYLLLF